MPSSTASPTATTPLERARKDARLSREYLGARAGVSLSVIYHAERNGRVPQLQNRRALAAALDTTIDELFPGQPSR